MSGVVAGGSGETSSWAGFRGRPVDVAMSYNNRDSGWGDFDHPWNLGAYRGFNGSLVESVPYAPSNVGASLAACAAGAYNWHFAALGSAVNHSQFQGGKFILRLSWEMNGNYFYWDDTNNAQWIRCFQQEASAFKWASPRSLVDFTINGHGTSASGISRGLDAYPGDAYVDIVGIDNYDHYTGARNQAVFNSLANGPDGIYTVANFARAHGKRFSVGEWGVATCEGSVAGGDNPFYIRAMYNTFRKYASFLAYEAYFNYAGEGCYSLHAPVQAPVASVTYRSLF